MNTTQSTVNETSNRITALDPRPLASVGVKSSPRAFSERTFRSCDGAELFYRAWLPAASARQALVLFHRGHEHSGRFAEMVDRLELDDVAIFAWDARGHGRSPGERGYAESFSDVVRDIDCFIRHIEVEHGIPMRRMIVLGHSVGAVGVAAWVHDYAPPVAGMVLATPAFRVKLYIPFALSALRVLSRFRKKAFIKSYVKPRMLTHDPEQAALYASDTLISRQIAVNILVDLYHTSTRLMADAGAICVPTLILSAGSDWVVKKTPQQRFFERLSSKAKRIVRLDGFYHAVFHEQSRQRAFDAVRDFVRQQLAAAELAGPIGLLHADRERYTKTEYDKLSKPLPIASPRGAWFRGQRLFLKTIGRLSDGIRIGWRNGFDSGQSLDYIYENKPRGITPIGKLIDYFYLQAIGWRGIRQRKIHLQQMLSQTIRQMLNEGKTVRLLDIAAGPGRYVLETLQDFSGQQVSAVLRDRNEEGLEQGRRIAAQMGLSNVVYQTGDAFDRAALAALFPSPNIAVVSGLYELFPSNEPIVASLQGLAAALREGGYLIYTNQPWHPQVEMIARVLPNRDGKPWVMRRRTQAEMDELVRAAGFEKLQMLIDHWGIFTVSLARRVTSPPQKAEAA